MLLLPSRHRRVSLLHSVTAHLSTPDKPLRCIVTGGCSGVNEAICCEVIGLSSLKSMLYCENKVSFTSRFAFCVVMQGKAS